MKRILAASIIFCCYSLSATWGQNAPQKAYLHLTGGIEGGVKVSMNLIRTGDTLYGDFTYSLADYTRGTFDVSAGEYIDIYGKVAHDDSFWLKEWGNDKGPVITGKFTNSQTLSGYWELSPGAGKLPFLLTERISAGSVPLQVHYLDDRKPLVHNPSSPTAKSKQCILVPGPGAKGKTSDSVKRIIMSKFAGEVYSGHDPDLLLKNLQKQFFDEYTSGNDAIYKQMPDAGSLNWIMFRMMHILYNDQHFLSFYILNYGFTGGAHGMENREYTVVSTADAKIIRVSDIFMHGYEAAVGDLLTSKLKAMKGLGDHQKLSENGYFVDFIEPNDNFFVTNHGIGFQYDPYEIAPYSNGSTVIFLPFTDLAPFLKDDSLIGSLLGE